MGMQCQFSIHPEDGEATLCEGCDDYYSITLNNGAIVGASMFERTELDVECERRCFWFDIGSVSDAQMTQLRKLIVNRICFSCS